MGQEDARRDKKKQDMLHKATEGGKVNQKLWNIATNKNIGRYGVVAKQVNKQ